MNIDKTMWIDADEWRAGLRKLAQKNDAITPKPGWDYDEFTRWSGRNSRQRYLRFLDKITGEKGRYGDHHECHATEFSPGALQIHFEHR